MIFQPSQTGRKTFPVHLQSVTGNAEYQLLRDRLAHPNTQEKLPSTNLSTACPWRGMRPPVRFWLSLGLREDGGRLALRRMWVINWAKFHLKRKTFFPNFSHRKGKTTHTKQCKIIVPPYH